MQRNNVYHIHHFYLVHLSLFSECPTMNAFVHNYFYTCQIIFIANSEEEGQCLILNYQHTLQWSVLIIDISVQATPSLELVQD